MFRVSLANPWQRHLPLKSEWGVVPESTTSPDPVGVAGDCMAVRCAPRTRFTACTAEPGITTGGRR